MVRRAGRPQVVHARRRRRRRSIDALEELDLAYPKVDATKREELKLVKSELEREGAGKKKEKKSKS